MSEWYTDLYYKDFKGKHVLVTYDDGTAIMGAVTYGVLETRESGREISDCYVRLMPAFAGIEDEHTDDTSIAVLVCMEDDRWWPLDGIKSVDLIWDEKEYEQIPVDQIRNLDYVVFNGHLYQVTGALSPYFYIGVDSVVMYGRIDKSMISTALRRRSSKS